MLNKKFHRPAFATSNPDLEVVRTDDHSNTLRCRKKHVTWHSESGALSESEVVFIRNSQIQDRMTRRAKTQILEIGFGTGLNFFLAASMAFRNCAKLDYFAIEPDRLEQSIIDQLRYDQIPACQPAVEQFVPAVFQKRLATVETDDVTLALFDDLSELTMTPGKFDAVFHDPFAPDIAPKLWSEDVFCQLFERLIGHGRLVTYCVKSSIQKRLVKVGFQVSKTPGPVGGKREVLVAVKPLVD